MLAAWPQLLLHIMVSPRRLLIVALLATFLYAALVTTKARLLPESAATVGRGRHASEEDRTVAGRSDDRRKAEAGKACQRVAGL
jgi:hypothetical protein